MQKIGKIISLCAISITSFFPAALWAVMSSPYGWYIEGNIGFPRVMNKNYPGSTTPPKAGANLDVGYKFMPYFGGEIGATWYGGTVIDAPSCSKAATDNLYSYHLAAKGILPYADTGFEAFAKIGATRVRSRLTLDNSAAAASIGLTSNTSSTTGLYFAVGGSYYFNSAMAVVLQWARAKGNDSTGSVDLWSVGVNVMNLV